MGQVFLGVPPTCTRRNLLRSELVEAGQSNASKQQTAVQRWAFSTATVRSLPWPHGPAFRKREKENTKLRFVKTTLVCGSNFADSEQLRAERGRCSVQFCLPRLCLRHFALVLLLLL